MPHQSLSYIGVGKILTSGFQCGYFKRPGMYNFSSTLRSCGYCLYILIKSWMIGAYTETCVLSLRHIAFPYIIYYARSANGMATHSDCLIYVFSRIGEKWQMFSNVGWTDRFHCMPVPICLSADTGIARGTRVCYLVTMTSLVTSHDTMVQYCVCFAWEVSAALTVR